MSYKTVKRLLLFCCTTVLIFSLDLFAFSNTSLKLTKKEQDFIKNNPQITISMMSNFKPFSFIEEGIHQGYSVDILNKISQRTGLTFFIDTGLWNQNLEKFQKQQVTLVSDISYTKKRSDYTLFTDPYYSIPTYVFGLKNDTNYKGIESLIGKKVAVSHSIYYKDDLIKKGVNVIEVISSHEKAKMLALGKVDYFLSSFTSGKKAVVSQSLTNIKPIDELESIKKEDLRFGIQKEFPMLHQIMSKALKSISKQEKNDLSNKWIIQLKEISKKRLFLTPKESAYLSKKSAISVCYDPNWAPFEFAYKSSRNIVGINPDTLKLLFSYIKKPIVAVPTSSWQESLDNFKQGECEIISSVSTSNFKNIDALFTQPYIKLPLAVFTTKDKPLIGNLQELNGKTWSRQHKSGLIELIQEKYPNYRIKHTKNNIEALQYVSEGKVDFTISTLPTAYDIMNKYLIDNLKVAAYTNLDYQLSIAVNKHNPELLSILEKSLQLIDEKERSAIFNRWVKKPIQKETIDYTLMMQILAVILALVLALLYRQHILNQANTQLEQKVLNKTKQLHEVNAQLEKRIQQEIDKNSEKDKLLAHQSKMIAIGEMLENIAHQWRQPLSVIGTSITGLKVNAELENDITKEQIIETSDIINKQTQYLSHTIEDFRSYFSGDTKGIETFNLKQVIEKMQSLTNDSFRNNYIKAIISLEDCIIEHNKNLLMQAMINIYNNAKDAIVQNVENTDHRFLFITLEKEKNHAIIKLRDSGGGIEENILEKVFEPYFTTKHKSIGTGLGLYMTHQIITKQILGSIRVQNVQYEYEKIPLKGAEFSISLPL